MPVLLCRDGVIGWGKLLFAPLGFFVVYSRVPRSAVLEVSPGTPGNSQQTNKQNKQTFG